MFYSHAIAMAGKNVVASRQMQKKVMERGMRINRVFTDEEDEGRERGRGVYF
jgi:hypothetical protein